MLSPAKALGALTSGVPLLMMAAYDLDNAKHHRLGLPEDNLAAIFLIIAGGICFISLTLTLLMNPYPLVKEPDDPYSRMMSFYSSANKVRGEAKEWKRGYIKF